MIDPDLLPEHLRLRRNIVLLLPGLIATLFLFLIIIFGGH